MLETAKGKTDKADQAENGKAEYLMSNEYDVVISVRIGERQRHCQPDT